MSFGKNPHVAKAEAAELKAGAARDSIAAEQAWREAARLWDRAAERENDQKRRQIYVDKAELARSNAENGEPIETSLPELKKIVKGPDVLN
ncbi:MAG: hypothetical protein IPK60_14800 [Sandaracinaceae bacterium]|nr:hypothetical protein [Sandaracinaceae bacterium]